MILIVLYPERIHVQPVINIQVAENAILIHEDEINTSTYEFSPVFYGTYIGFVNDRGKSIYYDKKKNTPFFDLSFAGANTEGNLAKKAAFSPAITTENQEGPFCFYDNDQTILLTRSTREHKNLLIYKAQRFDGHWIEKGKVELMPPSFHVCHPTVSPSGHWLIFAAAPIQEGSTMDLYMAEREDNQWVRVNKLPDHVQSQANDWFPRFINDSILVFSSDRDGGMGGLDVYAIKHAKEGWTTPQQFPYPVNTAYDDFGLIASEGVAYFSSNRPGGAGKDDLYRIEFGGELFYTPKSDQIDLHLSLKNKLGLAPIAGATVEIFPFDLSKLGQSISTLNIQLVDSGSSPEEIILKLQPSSKIPSDVGVTNEYGRVVLKIKEFSDYIIHIKADKYLSLKSLFNVREFGESITLVLEPKEEPAWEDLVFNPIVELDEGATIVFDNIYYDFNSHIIKAGAAIELDQLADAMIANPNLNIELSAHTDSRGSRVYNQRLSERRALSAKNYLVKKGIDPNRIRTFGYGENQIRNRCKDRVPCSEEEHRFNRRTEVKIIKK